MTKFENSSGSIPDPLEQVRAVIDPAFQRHYAEGYAEAVVEEAFEDLMQGPNWGYAGQVLADAEDTVRTDTSAMKEIEQICSPDDSGHSSEEERRRKAPEEDIELLTKYTAHNLERIDRTLPPLETMPDDERTKASAAERRMEAAMREMIENVQNFQADKEVNQQEENPDNNIDKKA